jgi:alkaline phosphatase D
LSYPIAWDGYQANRKRLLTHITDNKINNIAVFTGDTHANWLFENSLETTLQGTNDTYSLKNVVTSGNRYQPGTLVEYGGTAVSSTGWGLSLGSVENATIAAEGMVKGNPSLLFTEGYRESTVTF